MSKNSGVLTLTLHRLKSALQHCRFQDHSAKMKIIRLRSSRICFLSWSARERKRLGPPFTAQEVEEVSTATDEPLNLESVINLKMPSQNGVRNVARLLTHCSPQNHVNFLVKMFDSNDLDYAGGELGSIQDATKGHVSFLSTKLSSMVMKTDDEFEAGASLRSTGWLVEPCGCSHERGYPIGSIC